MLANMERFIAAMCEGPAALHSRPTVELPELPALPEHPELPELPELPEPPGGDEALAAAPWHAIGSTLGLGSATPAAEDQPDGDRLPVPVGSTLGRYLVLGMLGRGGMGTVLKAYDESLDRTVAIKLLRRGTVAREAQRLQREAQALAKLSHPNVVHVYEVARAQGRWFIAMELVRGQTLRCWQRQEHDWRETVAVYLQAGRGLAAAHAVDLVHRDFKPDNCIIDEQGRVRVLDFGLVHQSPESLESKPEHSDTASAHFNPDSAGSDLDSARSDPDSARSDPDSARSDPDSARSDPDSARSPFRSGGSSLDIEAVRIPMAPLTSRGTLMGTPGYMALEHLELQQTDARSDQFSFCVSLYEALYGERPYAGSSLPELLAALHDEQLRPVPKASPVPTKLRTVLLRGLAADPDARWPSMEALVLQLQQLVTPRRRWPVILGGGIATGMGLLGIGLAYQAQLGQRCTGARAQMDGIWDDGRRQLVETAILGTERSYAADTWERIAPRLQAYADAWVNAHTEICETTSVRGEQSYAAMDLRMRCLGQRRTALRATVDVLADADAKVVHNAVELVAGLPPLDRCDDMAWLEAQNQRMPPPEDPGVAATVQALRARLAEIDAMHTAGRYAEALEQLEAVAERAEMLEYPPLIAETSYWRGTLQQEIGDNDKAEQALRRAYTLAVKYHHDRVMLDAAQALTYLVGYELVRHTEGLLLGELVALPLAERRGDPADVAGIFSGIGAIFTGQGKYEKAMHYFQQALTLCEKTLPPDHQLLVTSLNSMGEVSRIQAKYEEAMRYHQRALAIQEQARGPNHPLVADILGNIGITLDNQGQNEESRRHLLQALTIQQKARGPNHPVVAGLLNNLGSSYADQGEYEEARRYYQRAREAMENALGPDHPDLAIVLRNLGNSYISRQEFEQAQQHYERALTIQQKALGPEHPHVADGINALGNVAFARREYEQAKPYYQRALALWEKTQGPDHPDLAYPLIMLAGIAMRQGDLESARAYNERALEVREQAGVAPHLIAEARFELAKALWNERSERGRARALAEQARATWVDPDLTSNKGPNKVEAWLANHRLK